MKLLLDTCVWGSARGGFRQGVRGGCEEVALKGGGQFVMSYTSSQRVVSLATDRQLGIGWAQEEGGRCCKSNSLTIALVRSASGSLSRRRNYGTWGFAPIQTEMDESGCGALQRALSWSHVLSEPPSQRPAVGMDSWAALFSWARERGEVHMPGMGWPPVRAVGKAPEPEVSARLRALGQNRQCPSSIP